MVGIHDRLSKILVEPFGSSLTWILIQTTNNALQSLSQLLQCIFGRQAYVRGQDGTQELQLMSTPIPSRGPTHPPPYVCSDALEPCGPLSYRGTVDIMGVRD